MALTSTSNQFGSENLQGGEPTIAALANLSRRRATSLTARQRAERLYHLDKLEAAARFLAKETIQ